MPIGIRIRLENLAQANVRLQRIYQLTRGGGQGAASLSELHRRYGIRALQWINENFEQEGGLLSDGPWQKLAESTIAAKGSSKVLQDTGIELRPSFVSKPTSTEVRVGSSKLLAKWHEEGTGQYGPRGRPYPIVPVRARALAFPASPSYTRFARTTTFNSATGVTSSRPRVTRVRASFSSIATKKTYRAGQVLILTKGVMHPGVVKRRMLPTEQELLPRLRVTTENWLRQFGVEGAITSE
jgi:hypothetical protein